MLRRHLKTFATYSLITALLSAPVFAATPGDASRRAAERGRTARASGKAKSQPTNGAPVRTAFGTGSQNNAGSVQQVVGKQPTAAKINPNRSFSLLPSLFGGSKQATPIKQTQPTRRSTSTRQNASSDPSRAKGILSDLFGSKTKPAPRPAQPAKNTEPKSIDWDGIPYHQARSTAKKTAPTPLRDPGPGETRISGPSRLAKRPLGSGLAAEAPKQINPAVPQPPALAPAPSSRRVVPSRVASSKVRGGESATLSPLSSSRRSGRREIPTLDASEVAAAKKSAIPQQSLVPKVARRQLGSEKAKSDPKPSNASPVSKPVSVAKKSIAKPKTAPEATPSADVAVTQPKKSTVPELVKPAPTKPATTTPNPSSPEPQSIASNAANTPANSSAPATPAEAPAAEPVKAPVQNSVADATPTGSVAAPMAKDVAPVPQVGVAATEIAASNQPTAPQVSIPAERQATEPAPAAPANSQFVAPNLPAPATPQFGPNASVAGHRIGPPASSFQPRTPPRPVLKPSSVPFGPSTTPIGSGIATPQRADVAATVPQAPPTDAPYQAPPAPAYGTPGYSTPGYNTSAYNTPPSNAFPHSATPYNQSRDPYQTPRVAKAPYPTPYPGTNDPYAERQRPPYRNAPNAPVQERPYAPRDASSIAAPSIATPPAPQSPSVPAQPSYRESNAFTQTAPRPSSGLGTPSPYAPRAFSTPPPVASPERFDRERMAETASQPPAPAMRESISSELPAGQTAVASELPGIRVITAGPSSVMIKQTKDFEIRVENRGAIDAAGVMIRTVMPSWAEIKGRSTSRGNASIQSIESTDRLVWTLDSLPAGSAETLHVRLQALQSGIHGLDVDWTLVPQKSVAKVEVREPKLDLVIEGPESVVYGESQTYRVRVLNPGDGVAPNVVFTLSPNSATPQTQRIGNIPSGKEAQFEVELTAQDLGDLKIHGLASGDLDLKAQAAKTIRVDAADLEAVLAGPEAKYQNTDANYHLEVTNSGSATSKNITASLALPTGIRYKGGIDGAQKRGTKLSWKIDSLPPGATRDYEFSCTMVSPGEQTFEFSAQGSAAGQTSVALGTRVESIADLVMTIQDPTAPAPVGSEVIYEILIKNRGSRQAQGVRAIAQFSEGIEPRRIEGHRGQVLTGQVLFDPIEVIRPGEEVRIRVIAEAEREGHHRFRTEIRSGETVLVAEEATQYLNKRSERVSRRSSSSRR